MVISQVKAEKAALDLGLGQELSDQLRGKLSYRIFMNRITSKRKPGNRTIDVQNANRLEEFVISQKVR